MARPDKPPIEARPPADDPLAFQVLNEVGILSQLSANRAARLLAPGLNLSQFSLLNHLSRLGGERSLVQLASAMQVTKAAMTNTVTRLQAKGLLAVQPDPQDGRGKRVSLTPAGLAARQQAVQQPKIKQPKIKQPTFKQPAFKQPAPAPAAQPAPQSNTKSS